MFVFNLGILRVAKQVSIQMFNMLSLSGQHAVIHLVLCR